MFGIDELYSFLTSVATQIRAAIYVGVPVEDGPTRHLTVLGGPTSDTSAAELWDDAPGRMTRNGLGTLEIGAGKTRIDE